MPISDKRTYQLAYCKLCNLRSLDSAAGITCGLTNKVADFEKECADMQLDFDAVEGKEIEAHNGILKHIRSNYDLFQLKKENYILPSQPFYSKYYTKGNTHKLKFKEIQQGSISFQLALLSLITFSILTFNVGNSFKLLFGFFAFIALCFTIIRAVVEYYTLSLIHI